MAPGVVVVQAYAMQQQAYRQAVKACIAIIFFLAFTLYVFVTRDIVGNEHSLYVYNWTATGKFAIMILYDVLEWIC